MRRSLLPFWAALLLIAPLLRPSTVRAEDEPEPVPPLATEEEADEALATWKADDKAAKRERGDERTAMREVAMRHLARTQHPDVADRLFKLTRDRDPDIRTLAVMYLGEQRALPGYAGPLVEKAVRAHDDDPVLVMFGIEAVETLKWRGSVKLLRDLLQHDDDGVKKVALLTVGGMEELRMIDDIIKLMVDLKIDQGVKWEGGEVTYDTGAPGTHDQEMAEKIYQEKYGSRARRGRGAARAMRDMKPIVLETMKLLTGEEFETTAHAQEWLEANKEPVKEAQTSLGQTEKDQARQAKDL